MEKIVLVTGGFDPLHSGHLAYLKAAKKLGDKLFVGINSDDWLMRKKGYVFMPWKERAYIMGNIKGVSLVTGVNDADGTVCQAIGFHQPDAFANGGDRKKDNTPEMDVCRDLKIEMIWNVGGGKIQSSSDLVSSASDFIGEF